MGEALGGDVLVGDAMGFLWLFGASFRLARLNATLKMTLRRQLYKPTFKVARRRV